MSNGYGAESILSGLVWFDLVRIWFRGHMVRFGSVSEKSKPI